MQRLGTATSIYVRPEISRRVAMRLSLLQGGRAATKKMNTEKTESIEMVMYEKLSLTL